MPSLPQILEEDIQVLNSALQELLDRSQASAALLIDKGGFLITRQGDTEQFDATTIGALAAASFSATQGMADLVSESNFNSVYQQGERFSLLVQNVDTHCLLVVIFSAELSAGAVKYYALAAVQQSAAQLEKARARQPTQGLDLSLLNVADTDAIFRKKSP